MSSTLRPRIDADLCIARSGCRECILACPSNLLVLLAERVRVREGAACEPFWACFYVCPMAAITIEPEFRSNRDPA
jgi:ferredoxin